MRQKKFLYLAVKEKIQRQIAAMEPRAKIPSRNELMEQYGVTRTTIDRAVSELVGEGHLYAVDGSGTYVAEHRQSQRLPGFRSRTVGVVVPNIASHDYPEIVRGIEDAADQKGYSVIVCSTDNRAEKQKHHINRLINANVSGIILVPVVYEIEVESLRRLQAENIPLVFCNRSIDGFDAPAVIDNNFLGAYLATKHFIQAGCQNVAFLSGPVYSTAKERFQGYLAALAEYGMAAAEDLILFEAFQAQDEYGPEGVKQLMERNPSMDAILCVNDRIAYAAVKTLLDADKLVPCDISVIGFDNSSVCEMSPVKLSSISYNKYNTGYRGGLLLVDSMESAGPRHNRLVVSMPELILRESSRRTRI